MTMLVVDTKPFAHTAQATVLAVKNRLFSITEKSTGATVVFCKLAAVAFLALTELSDWLNGEAVHAKHLFCCISINLVIGCLIVAQPAGEKLSTALCTNLGLTRVVFTAEDALGLVMV
jgi:hypothetical protein